MNTAVECRNVSMSFNVATERVDTIKEYFLRTIKLQHSTVNRFLALEDISFSIKQGESVGIIGKNGSGKSTLLKLVAGVLSPTNGRVVSQGRIAPLIELGAGFDMDLTARENIFLNGAMLGYDRTFMKEHLSRIIDFSELEAFIDVPVKNFSSGMLARLAFSIATFVKPELLIVDEALGVGDSSFQLKCNKRIEKLLEQNTTLLFVSHDESAVKATCQKALWLEKGRVEAYGAVDAVFERYNAAQNL